MKSLLKAIAIFAFALAGAADLLGQESSPITIVPKIQETNGQRALLLKFHVPELHHLYAERLSFEIGGQSVIARLPQAVLQLDKYSGKSAGVYTQDFTASVPLTSAAGNLELVVNLQGCSDSECYFPETRKWSIHPDQTVVSLDTTATSSATTPTLTLTSGFKITARASGFVGKREFLTFLEQGTDSARSSGGNSTFAGTGGLATVLLILLGGLALNLTPCVLPMIPINLAILGAGVNGGNRQRGVALGGAYGMGMALAYGALGLVVVLTGSKFGTLNSSAWFNFGIAIVFVVLGLAMFDKIAIDLSRFQRSGSPRKSGSNAAFLGAGLMGSVSALLAGACVAPVVISVLLLATTSFQQGKLLGLLYPFILGLGMALPWPFAAGGLSFLPKPGRWMVRIKYGFGVLIFGFALWYGWLGWNLTRIETVGVNARGTSDSVNDLRATLQRSHENGKPVFVDFWASWCKNCEAMEHTTFRDQEIRDRLKQFEVVRFEAEHLNDPAAKLVLDEFGIMGLPGFVVLKPDNAQKSGFSDTSL